METVLDSITVLCLRTAKFFGGGWLAAIYAEQPEIHIATTITNAARMIVRVDELVSVIILPLELRSASQTNKYSLYGYLCRFART